MANIKTVQERNELHKAIWNIADELRGSVGGWEFKNYVLGTMFYRYISEKEEAKAALLKMCKNKFLLPKDFASEQRLEKITGMYVPFWLYDCEGDLDGTYRATRVKRWSDSSYNYTKTDH